MRLSKRMRATKAEITWSVSRVNATIDMWADEVSQLEEALIEQLHERGYAFRGKCDGVPDDIRRAFIALGTPCDEIDEKALAEKKE